MASEVFFDTSGFFALMDEQDSSHARAVEWLQTQRGRIRPVTTARVVREACTLLIARKRPHMVPKFLDYLGRSLALLLINPDDALVRSAKAKIRRQAGHGFSFVDCLSFYLMQKRKILEALTTDAHFGKAGFLAALAPS